jgi:hypothetical protein
MDILFHINNNKFLTGLAMIAMNFGSRYVIGDISKFQDEFLKSNVAKKFVLLCIFFVATRDIMVAVMLTFAFYFVIHGLFNENKQYNVLTSFIKPFKETLNMYDTMINKTQLI